MKGGNSLFICHNLSFHSVAKQSRLNRRVAKSCGVPKRVICEERSRTTDRVLFLIVSTPSYLYEGVVTSLIASVLPMSRLFRCGGALRGWERLWAAEVASSTFFARSLEERVS